MVPSLFALAFHKFGNWVIENYDVDNDKIFDEISQIWLNIMLEVIPSEYYLDYLACNPLLTSNVAAKNLEKLTPRLENPEKFKCEKIGIELDELSSHPELATPFCYCQEVEINDILEFSKIKWDFNALSGNKNISPELVLATTGCPWNKQFLSSNEIVTIDLVLGYPGNWHTSDLSYNPGIKIEDIIRYPQLGWNYASVSYRNDLKFNHVLILQNEDLCWHEISKRDFITPKIIKDHDLPWDIEGLCCNPNMHLDDILKFNKNEDWKESLLSRYLSKNPNADQIQDLSILTPRYLRNLCHNKHVSDDTIEKCISLLSHVNFTIISYNQNISWEFIDKYASELDWATLSNREDLTPELILKYKDRWDFHNLMVNPMTEWSDKKLIGGYQEVFKNIFPEYGTIIDDLYLKCRKLDIL